MSVKTYSNVDEWRAAMVVIQKEKELAHPVRKEAKQ
jgi:hypothetical protein